MQKLVEKYLAHGDRYEYSESHKLYFSIYDSDRFAFNDEVVRQIKQRNKIKKAYYYMLTFTLKPSIPLEETDSIESYIKQQLLRPPLQIEESHIVRELTKCGVPHWHVAIKTGIFLKKNRFNYYIKKYGNIDISKNKGQTLNEMINYMSKVNIPDKVSG